MPNSANKQNGNSNRGQGSAHQPTEGHQEREQKPNPERSDVKHNTNQNDGNTSRTSNQGRKSASGGSAED